MEPVVTGSLSTPLTVTTQDISDVPSTSHYGFLGMSDLEYAIVGGSLLVLGGVQAGLVSDNVKANAVTLFRLANSKIGAQLSPAFQNWLATDGKCPDRRNGKCEAGTYGYCRHCGGRTSQQLD